MPPSPNAEDKAVMDWRVSQLEKALDGKLDAILSEVREWKRSHDESIAALRKEFGDRLTALEMDRAKAMGAGWLAKIILALIGTGIVGVAFQLWQVLQRLPPQ